MSRTASRLSCSPRQAGAVQPAGRQAGPTVTGPLPLTNAPDTFSRKACRREGIQITQQSLSGAVGQQVLRDLRIAIQQRQFVGRSPESRVRRVDVHAMLDQPVAFVPSDCILRPSPSVAGAFPPAYPGELPSRLNQTPSPPFPVQIRTATPGGAYRRRTCGCTASGCRWGQHRFQKQPRELIAVLMFRLMHWAGLSLAEDAGKP